jgi:hypothetical protein
VELVAVHTDEEARRLRFPGSPTFRVDKRDLFPASEREDWWLGCRVYATPEGLKGSPTTDMLREALGTRSDTYDAGSPLSENTLLLGFSVNRGPFPLAPTFVRSHT